LTPDDGVDEVIAKSVPTFAKVSRNLADKGHGKFLPQKKPAKIAGTRPEKLNN
jgi:hypothetical protein